MAQFNVIEDLSTLFPYIILKNKSNFRWAYYDWHVITVALSKGFSFFIHVIHHLFMAHKITAETIDFLLYSVRALHQHRYVILIMRYFTRSAYGCSICRCDSWTLHMVIYLLCLTSCICADDLNFINEKCGTPWIIHVHGINVHFTIWIKCRPYLN